MLNRFATDCRIMPWDVMSATAPWRSDLHKVFPSEGLMAQLERVLGNRESTSVTPFRVGWSARRATAVLHCLWEYADAQ